MLDENQATIDAVIGSANYDIGHVFSTGGGGIAYLGVPCAGGYKARGVTGSGAPVGDAFDVDYVAHEMGHQFGAEHTFNSESGFCGGNRAPSSAYEPGSGSTIMAYAGICSPENLQPNSDPYFHSRSFDQILDYSQNPFGGDGCAVKTNTSNAAPVVDAGAVYTIPARTPFFMTGSATDADGDALTYDWQQYDYDLDASTFSPDETTADDGKRPLFRVFNPTTSPTRYFPQLADLLDGTTTYGMGDVLTTRALNFRLVVRDGQGGVTHDAARVEAVDTGAAFAVTAPSGGETWPTGSEQTVTWNVAGTNAAPISCSRVDIRQSRDGGVTWPFTPTKSTPNDGSTTVTLRGAPSSAGRIGVFCAGSIFFNVSAGDIDVANGPYLTSAAPASVLSTGGTAVSVVGANLSGATSATVGGVDAPFLLKSATQAVITVPVGIVGTVVSVSVRTPAGEAILDDAVTYAAPIAVNSAVIGAGGGVISTTGITITAAPVGTEVTLTLTPTTPSDAPQGTFVSAFRVTGESSGAPLSEFPSTMTITMTYGSGITTVEVPTLYERSGSGRGLVAGWTSVSATINRSNRTVTAALARLSEYVLVAAPASQVYVPLAVR
jgi:hypothetical protein